MKTMFLKRYHPVIVATTDRIACMPQCFFIYPSAIENVNVHPGKPARVNTLTNFEQIFKGKPLFNL